MADKIKLALAVLLVIAGVAGFYCLGDKALILRVGSVLAGMVAAVLVAWMTEPGRQFHVYAQEAVVETMQSRADLYALLGYHDYERKLDELSKNGTSATETRRRGGSQRKS